MYILVKYSCSTKGRASLVIGKQRQRRKWQGLRWQWQAEMTCRVRNKLNLLKNFIQSTLFLTFYLIYALKIYQNEMLSSKVLEILHFKHWRLREVMAQGESEKVTAEATASAEVAEAEVECQLSHLINNILLYLDYIYYKKKLIYLI